MNARDIALAEARHERHMDSLMDDADMAAALHEERVKDACNAKWDEFAEHSQACAEFVWDTEFGGEYFLPEILVEYARSRGDLANFGMMVSRKLERAMQSYMIDEVE